MKRILAVLLLVLPFQAHAVLMRAVATGTIIDSEDETGQFGYGTTDVSNPLDGATTWAQWTYDSEKAAPMTNWVESVLIVRPRDPNEPVLKFYDKGGPTGPVIGANVCEDFVRLENDGAYGPEGVLYDRYWVNSWSRYEPSDERYTWLSMLSVLSFDTDLISSDSDLSQELNWKFAATDLAYGNAQYREGGGISRLEYELTSFTVRQVPEPAPLGMVGAGLLGLGVMRRKRAA